ncbi:MAG: methylated-DNA--[protein]-cysteine S-methyltransferase [Candidatus Lokiarchaeota archaeon]|nr:methylated-DNA--[protein]-cysteine S-methyltransferase [Candidatus Lokiarchaeota archaeon]
MNKYPGDNCNTMMDKSEVKTEEDIRRFLADRTEFEKDVYLATYRIPEGKVSTYGRIAKKIGRPNAYRAVGNTLHKNPLHPVVPCHRVVKNDGSFGGDEKRAAERRKQVEDEDVPISNGKVQLCDDILWPSDE